MIKSKRINMKNKKYLNAILNVPKEAEIDGSKYFPCLFTSNRNKRK